MYRLSQRSKQRLAGVHPDLVAVVKYAIEITPTDFTVLEGLRSLSRQKKLLKRGATRTLNSRHLTGHAVDLGAWVEGRVSWMWCHYVEISKAVKQAADELNIEVEWGGDWQTFKDGAHFQLPWGMYQQVA